MCRKKYVFQLYVSKSVRLKKNSDGFGAAIGQEYANWRSDVRRTDDVAIAYTKGVVVC